MRFKLNLKVALISLLSISLTGFAASTPAFASSPQINLCQAGNYATLSNVLTNAADVVVTSETPGTLIGATSSVESDALVTPGGNLVAQHSGSAYVAAIGDLRYAIDSIRLNLQPSATVLRAESLSSEVLVPNHPGVFPAGIYATSGAMSISANSHITLAGDAHSVFVFIATEALNVGANVQILLTGGAQAKNVYWVVGTFVGAATSGASSTLVGNFLVDGTMTIGASTQLTGRVLAINTITFGAGVHLAANPQANTCGASMIPPVITPDTKTIEFIDTTLTAGTQGNPYNDVVSARTVLNGNPDNQTITYTINPSLVGLGLSMDTTGVITGTISNSATVGIHQFTVTATSNGYTTQTFVCNFEIKAAPVITPDTKTLSFSVYFAAESSKLSSQEQRRILQLISTLASRVIRGTVYGYVRTTSNHANDMKLSAARAKVVARFLTAHGVIVPLITQGKGVLGNSVKARKAVATLTYTSAAPN